MNNNLFNQPKSDEQFLNKRQLAEMINRDVNKMISDAMSPQSDLLSDKLRKQGYNQQEIEEFFKKIRRDIQIKLFAEFKAKLTETAIETRNLQNKP